MLYKSCARKIMLRSYYVKFVTNSEQKFSCKDVVEMFT